MKRMIIIAGALLVTLLMLPTMTVERRKVLGDSTASASYISQRTDEINGYDETVVVKVQNGNEVDEIALNEYLRGVVAAEMPASYPEEALKAQTVAARSFILWCMEVSSKHDNADVCNDPTHCKAYFSDVDIRASYGAQTDEIIKKIDAIISETDGVVISYEGQPIMAAFFASSSGKTENAADIWGGEISYLVSVDSPENDNRTETVIGFDEFISAFREEHPEAVFGDSVNEWFSGTERSDAGSVLHINVGGVTVAGAEIRTLLSLPSANFTIMSRDEKLIFTTLGRGHGVGMSQTGAKAMAEAGKSYEEILQCYYSGVTIESRK